METSHIVFLVILGVFAVWKLWPKKKPVTTVFYDVVERIDVRPQRGMPRIVVNLLIVAGIGVILWIISQHGGARP